MDESEKRRYHVERQRRGDRTGSFSGKSRKEDDVLGSLRSPLRPKFERNDDHYRYEDKHATPRCRRPNNGNRTSWRCRPANMSSTESNTNWRMSFDDFPALASTDQASSSKKKDHDRNYRKPAVEESKKRIIKSEDVKKELVSPAKKDWATLVEIAELESLDESMMALSSEDEESTTPFATPSSGIGSSCSAECKPVKTEPNEDLQQTRSKRRLDLSRCSSTSSGLEEQENRTSKLEYETDEHILFRRQKTIDYGKNTPEYVRYLKEIPLAKRQKNEDPVTPKKHVKYSRRSWDAQIKLWRLKLHKWDPPTNDDGDDEGINLDDLNVEFLIEFENESA